MSDLCADNGGEVYGEADRPADVWAPITEAWAGSERVDVGAWLCAHDARLLRELADLIYDKNGQVLQDVEEEVAIAILRYPNHEASSWLAPVAAVARVMDRLALRAKAAQIEGAA